MELPKDSMNNFIILTNGFNLVSIAKCSIYRHHIVQMTRLAVIFLANINVILEKSRGHVSRKNLTFIDMNRELGMKKKPSKNPSFCPIEKRNETDNANFLWRMISMYPRRSTRYETEIRNYSLSLLFPFLSYFYYIESMNP